MHVEKSQLLDCLSHHEADALVLQEVMNGSVERELYVGHDAQHMRGVLTLKYPIRNGIVSNWDEMEMVSAFTSPKQGGFFGD